MRELKKLAIFANDAQFKTEFLKIKRENKQKLATLIYNEHEKQVNLDSMFDVQVKRIHEYKRQLLNLLHAVHLYNQIHDGFEVTPRTIIFAGKAAPGYFMAKKIIKLITSVAVVVNNDPKVGDKLKIFFLENYRVSLAEKIIPAADLSEQISTAGTEASGTGNMKFALNGALTIGTLDGANIEILEEVGEENFFLFGLRADEVKTLRQTGYNPYETAQKSPELMRILQMIGNGTFSQGDTELFKPIVDTLLYGGDPYFLCADFPSYIDCQHQVGLLYKRPEEWAKKAILNVANIGKFSSDRTIEDYAKEIWRLD